MRVYFTKKYLPQPALGRGEGGTSHGCKHMGGAEICSPNTVIRHFIVIFGIITTVFKTILSLKFKKIALFNIA